MARRYVAFLRAINVGGRTVRMERLRTAFEAMGLAEVSTFIASGNVIFGAGRSAEATLTARIEKGLLATLGYEVATFLRPVPDLAEIVEGSPFHDRTGGRTYVIFVREKPTRKQATALLDLCTATDLLHISGREVYAWSETSARDSPLSGARIEKLLDAPATIRNINTVARLAARYGQPGVGG